MLCVHRYWWDLPQTERDAHLANSAATAEDVADAILKDKSTGRVTNGQRVALSSVEEARTVTRDGTDYYLYEHVSQGSPNMNVRQSPSLPRFCVLMDARVAQRDTPGNATKETHAIP